MSVYMKIVSFVTYSTRNACSDVEKIVFFSQLMRLVNDKLTTEQAALTKVISDKRKVSIAHFWLAELEKAGNNYVIYVDDVNIILENINSTKNKCS